MGEDENERVYECKFNYTPTFNILKFGKITEKSAEDYYECIITNFEIYPDAWKEEMQIGDNGSCSRDPRVTRGRLRVFQDPNETRLWSQCALTFPEFNFFIDDLETVNSSEVYISIQDAFCGTSFNSTKLPLRACDEGLAIADPVISFDIANETHYKITLDNYYNELYQDVLFEEAMYLPKCHGVASRSDLYIFDGKQNDTPLKVFCAHDDFLTPTFFFHAGPDVGSVYIIIRDKVCQKDYRSAPALLPSAAPTEPIRTPLPTVLPTTLLPTQAPGLPFPGPTVPTPFPSSRPTPQPTAQPTLQPTSQPSPAPTAYECGDPLPDPVISCFNLVEAIPGSSSLRYWISIDNYRSFPVSMFDAAPYLPPCGRNTESSRTWVDIYDARTGQNIYGYCGLTYLLSRIWYAAQPGQVTAVYIVLQDRECQQVHTSNTIAMNCVG